MDNKEKNYSQKLMKKSLNLGETLEENEHFYIKKNLLINKCQLLIIIYW